MSGLEISPIAITSRRFCPPDRYFASISFTESNSNFAISSFIFMSINDLSLLPHMSDTKKVDLDKEYEKLSDKVSTLLDNTESEMNDLIEKFNENNDESIEVDTVDLSGKFSDLNDYVEDYS